MKYEPKKNEVLTIAVTQKSYVKAVADLEKRIVAVDENCDNPADFIENMRDEIFSWLGACGINFYVVDE